MPDTQNIENTSPAPQNEGEIHLSLSRRAAAIEAAYVLEALRK